MRVAFDFVSSANTTVIADAFATTWRLVTTLPLQQYRKPEPCTSAPSPLTALTVTTEGQSGIVNPQRLAFGVFKLRKPLLEVAVARLEVAVLDEDYVQNSEGFCERHG
jgi:hypothetical protein